MMTEIVDLDACSNCGSEVEPPESLNFVYPAGAIDSVKIAEKDLDTLDLGQYVNDNIINFYLRFLTLQSKLTEQIHVFNSFFYSTLVSLSPRTLNYERVQSWTKRINLFEKECLLVPIIQNMHWRLAIVGFPRLLFSGEETDRKPYLICFDSYTQGFDPIVSWALVEYLQLEWEARNGAFEGAPPAFAELQVIHPMQNNESDCGLFVLEFAERYLQEREEFHSAAAESCHLDRSHWFDCRDAEHKRFYLKWLVRLLADGRTLEDMNGSKEVYFLVPKSVTASRRRKRPRIPLYENFQYEL